MNIILPLRYKIIQPCGITAPVQIKILPKGSGSQVKHSSPILTDDIQRLLIFAGLCQCLQHIIAIKSGKIPCPSDRNYFITCPLRLHQPGNSH